jgi:hypothetical protein
MSVKNITYIATAFILSTLAALTLVYEAGRRYGMTVKQCPPADTHTADSLRIAAEGLGYRLMIQQDETAAIRARLDSMEAAPKQSPKQRVSYAFSSSYGMPVGALVDSLLATPIE